MILLKQHVSRNVGAVLITWNKNGPGSCHLSTLAQKDGMTQIPFATHCPLSIYPIECYTRLYKEKTLKYIIR